jgi:periplasmic protein CpxP/Spy
MRRITKIVGLTTVAAVVGTIGWHALADTPPRGPHGMGPGMMMGMGAGHGPMGGHFADPAAHLAALKTELKITAQQEAAWDAYAKTVESTATSMKAQRQGVKSMHDLSDQDRQAFMARIREQHETAFAGVKAAAEKLLIALDDTQKTKAQEILPGLAAHGPGMMQHTGMGGHGMMGHGGMAR